MKTGLFFGSFNPVHIGHMAIANYIIEYTDISQFWFVLSPHNPFKKKKSLLDNNHRLEMLNIAIDKDPRFWISDIEFDLPQPSFTSDTLAYSKEKYPKREFVLIMGSDGLPTFHKWKNYEEIISNYTRYVYPRPNFDAEEINNKKNIENIKMIEAPMIEISSSFIRKAIQDKKEINFFLPPKVYKYISEMRFYE